jgi:gliding motility-associated-like protein
MRSLIIVLAALFILTETEAQQFSKNHEISLPSDVQHAETAWIDVDNDGLLDNILFVTSSTGQKSLRLVKGDTLNPRELSTQIQDLPDYRARVVYDYDGDNDMDIVFSAATETILLRNNGSGWSAEAINLPPFTFAAFADIDHDGKNECIASGQNGIEKFTNVYSYSNLQWNLMTDTLQAELQSLQCVDFNKDGWNDLFLSGAMEDNKRFASYFIWEKGMFNLKQSLAIQASSAIADADGNGYIDVLGWGLNTLDEPRQFIYYYKPGQLLFDDDPASSAIIDFLPADINADGKIDSVIWSKTPVDSTLTLVINGGSPVNLPSSAIRGQAFGDMEHDGDLDLVQIVKDGVLKLVFYENSAPENKGPEGPGNGIAMRLFNYVFMYWNPAQDDHTPQHSITYDVRLESMSPSQPGQFDVANGRRMTVSHGNNGNANFKLLRDADRIGNFGYAIQAVDNAYHTGEKSMCVGSGFHCVEQVEEKVSVCTGEIKTLTAPPATMWFSLKEGYLTTGPEHKITTAAKDTVFSFLPDFNNCMRITSYLVDVDDDTVKTSAETLYRCEGDVIDLVGDGNTMHWQSESSGDLGSATGIQYTMDDDDEITGRIQYGPGCAVEKQFTLVVSAPDLRVTPQETVISLGSSVSLAATGAVSYEWLPAETLSQANVANPIASPGINTVYTVTGRDSIGCVGTATALVKVEGAGFLPSLFTPNGDGKNDELKVYGLKGDTKSFSLVISNRSGNTVFKTNSVQEAGSDGWDGSTNGVKQPNGVYFWRIEGINSSGERVVLNGKRKGSILLLR